VDPQQPVPPCIRSTPASSFLFLGVFFLAGRPAPPRFSPPVKDAAASTLPVFPPGCRSPSPVLLGKRYAGLSGSPPFSTPFLVSFSARCRNFLSRPLLFSDVKGETPPPFLRVVRIAHLTDLEGIRPFFLRSIRAGRGGSCFFNSS